MRLSFLSPHGLARPTVLRAYFEQGSSKNAGRLYSTAIAPSEELASREESVEELRRKRRTEWKRRQGGQRFLDNVIIHVRGGKGGDGCVAFHREKWIPYGPPSGGNGGRGADVYIMPSPHLTSLAAVTTRIYGQNGGTGKGTWQHGRNAPPLIIKVPLGTVVRELARDDSRRARDEYEAEEESLEGLEFDERKAKLRERRWQHYPDYAEDNIERDSFKEAERIIYREERERRRARMRRMQDPIYLDLDKPEETAEAADPDAPLGTRRRQPMGHLIAAGGGGGLGNPHFLSTVNRSPKFATRGYEGERVSLALELKLLADVGLVGMPNAGKSTLLRALSGGRAKTEVAGYAFTTLNPIVAVIRMFDDGTFEGSDRNAVYDETFVEVAREEELMESGVYADALTRNQRLETEDVAVPNGRRDHLEDFRFTVADNPGLIGDASADVGLGHSFLRSIERSHALAYVVDLSSPAPWDDLRVLRDEIEKYKPGLSPKARIVIANKADLLGGEPGEDAAVVEEARAKLKKLQVFVEEEMAVQLQDEDGNTIGTRKMDVVPISAKFNMNITRVITLMRGYVEEARSGAIVSASPASSKSPNADITLSLPAA